MALRLFWFLWLGLAGVAVVLPAGERRPPALACAPDRVDTLRVVPNDNRVPGGRPRSDGVVELSLIARSAAWQPEGAGGPEALIHAFAEEGCAPSVPGPLIRVPTGSVVEASIRNALPESLRVYGLQERPAAALDSFALQPGESRRVRFRAGLPGTYLYWGRTTRDTFALGLHVDGVLSGAIVVDSAGAAPANERLLVIGLWQSHPFPPRTPVHQREETLVFNGLAWPHTERLLYTVSDTVRWRVVNATRRNHPLHLHGFYYRVDARGSALRDTTYLPEQRRLVVTERLPSAGSMAVTWVPHTAGNWLFHCHLVEHIAVRMAPRPHDMGTITREHNHALEGMSGLILGIQVAPRLGEPAASEAPPRRRLRVFVTERPGGFGTGSAYSFVAQEGSREPAADSLRIPGSILELTRGEPTQITVLNRTRVPVAVHWHGIELPSYFDGVGGWSGTGAQVAPTLTPGDTFVVRITPRRSGTFMYHSHTFEAEQLGAGLYAPLLVLEPGVRRDTLAERVLVLARDGPASGAPPTANGQTRPVPLELQAGTTYRLRVINISPNENKELRLLAGSVEQQWRPVAKDGATLPAGQAVLRPARVLMGTGETWDFELRREVPQELTLEVVTTGLGLPPVRTPIRVRVLPR